MNAWLWKIQENHYRIFAFVLNMKRYVCLFQSSIQNGGWSLKRKTFFKSHSSLQKGWKKNIRCNLLEAISRLKQKHLLSAIVYTTGNPHETIMKIRSSFLFLDSVKEICFTIFEDWVDLKKKMLNYSFDNSFIWYRHFCTPACTVHSQSNKKNWRWCWLDVLAFVFFFWFICDF
jgi:hypothetical protein